MKIGGNIMDIDNLMDELEDILEASWRLPLSGGKAMVDTSEVKRILEDIRLALPREVVQAKKIVDERNKILDKAQSEIDAMMKISEEKVKSMVSKSEIVRSAQNTANDIISEANARAQEIKSSTNEYVSNMMKRLDETITTNLAEIRKARQMLQSGGRETISK